MINGVAVQTWTKLLYYVYSLDFTVCLCGVVVRTDRRNVHVSAGAIHLLPTSSHPACCTGQPCRYYLCFYSLSSHVGRH